MLDMLRKRKRDIIDILLESDDDVVSDAGVKKDDPARDLQFGSAIHTDSETHGEITNKVAATSPRSVHSEQNTLEAMLEDIGLPGSPVRLDAWQSMLDTALDASASSSSTAAEVMASSSATVGTNGSAELTEAQLFDLIDPLLPKPKPAAEWWYSDEFWDNVNFYLSDVRGTDWCVLDFFDDAPRSWTEALDAATSYINDNVVDSGHEFKIGITECCRKRWENPSFGWKWDKSGQPWEVMVVLYAAPTSKPRVMYSTGAFEKELVREFARVEGCLNCRGTGGETPSEGSPHFVYVVVRRK